MFEHKRTMNRLVSSRENHVVVQELSDRFLAATQIQEMIR